MLRVSLLVLWTALLGQANAFSLPISRLEASRPQGLMAIDGDVETQMAIRMQRLALLRLQQLELKLEKLGVHELAKSCAEVADVDAPASRENARPHRSALSALRLGLALVAMVLTSLALPRDHVPNAGSWLQLEPSLVADVLSAGPSLWKAAHARPVMAAPPVSSAPMQTSPTTTTIQSQPYVVGNAQVYVGTEKVEKAPSSTTFVRKIRNNPMQVDEMSGDDWEVLPASGMLQGLDAIKRANLIRPMKPMPKSHLCLQMMSLVHACAEEVDSCFEQFVNKFVSRYPLQLLRVDEIVVNVSLGGEATGRTQTLRFVTAFVASSMTGGYLKTVGLIETHDPATGRSMKLLVEVDGGSERGIADKLEMKIQRKRAMAHAAGSTDAPELLGMLKVGRIQKWTSYCQATGTSQMPTDIFEANELVTGSDGELELVPRMPGTNDIGILAWRCTLETRECPRGRDIVLMANDITVQAGSLGVSEDEFFRRAPEYTRIYRGFKIEDSHQGAGVVVAPSVEDQEDDSFLSEELAVSEAEATVNSLQVVVSAADTLGSRDLREDRVEFNISDVPCEEQIQSVEPMLSSALNDASATDIVWQYELLDVQYFYIGDRDEEDIAQEISTPVCRVPVDQTAPPKQPVPDQTTLAPYWYLVEDSSSDAAGNGFCESGSSCAARWVHTELRGDRWTRA